MYQNKTVLLIAGGGTLGTYVSEELLRLGCSVEVLCPEEKISHNERLCFHKNWATEEVLTNLFSKKRYDGIINFMHYPNAEKYKPMHTLLSENTNHLIFLSSYRVYADEQHPITEKAPFLLDVSIDQNFLEKETYALSKAKAEYFIRNESKTCNWTVVRPVISFSERRFDLVTRSGREIITKAKAGENITLPKAAKDLVAGLDWAGNSGKLIAHLLFKEDTLGEAYTVSSGQNLTWGEIADIYTELLGAKFEWIGTEAYMQNYQKPEHDWILFYDRLFDRTIDNRKVLNATGLSRSDFASIKEGIKIELSRMKSQG